MHKRRTIRIQVLQEPLMMSQICISEMLLSDYDSVHALLRGTSGIVLRQADSRDAIHRYLGRNPGLSLVAKDGTRLVGCVLCGHDGRRGYLHHLAVEPAFRHRGIGSALVEECLKSLRRLGIEKSHVDVLLETRPHTNSEPYRVGAEARRCEVLVGGKSEPVTTRALLGPAPRFRQISPAP